MREKNAGSAFMLAEIYILFLKFMNTLKHYWIVSRNCAIHVQYNSVINNYN